MRDKPINGFASPFLPNSSVVIVPEGIAMESNVYRDPFFFARLQPLSAVH